jgi:hypothetical protein
MLHDGRQGHRERRGDFRHRQFLLVRQAIDDGTARRIGERCEGEIELRIFIVNHVVKYCILPKECQAHVGSF